MTTTYPDSDAIDAIDAELNARDIVAAFVGADRSAFDPINPTMPAFAWPGGYAIYYVTDDADEMCAACVNTETSVHFSGERDGWQIVGAGAYGADTDYPEDDGAALCCHCNGVICPALD